MEYKTNTKGLYASSLRSFLIPNGHAERTGLFAQKYSITKIILFGSRARGTNTERSDIGIAVYGGDFDSFYWDVKEKTNFVM